MAAVVLAGEDRPPRKGYPLEELGAHRKASLLLSLTFLRTVVTNVFQAAMN